MNNLTVPQWTCLKGDMKNWFLYNVQKPFMMSPWVPESCGKKFYSFIFPCYLGCFWRGKGMKKTSIHDLDLIDWRKKQLTLGQQPVFFSGAAIFERLDYRLQELVLKVESQGEKNPGGRIVCVKFWCFGPLLVRNLLISPANVIFLSATLALETPVLWKHRGFVCFCFTLQRVGDTGWNNDELVVSRLVVELILGKVILNFIEDIERILKPTSGQQASKLDGGNS